MRRVMLALALALGFSGCFESGLGLSPAVTPTPRASASLGPAPEESASPEPETSPGAPGSSPAPLPAAFLPFVKRIQGVDRLFLFDPFAPEVIEIPEAFTGGPILNPFYFERNGEGRILYNSGGLTIECPEGSGILVPDILNFGAYVLDLWRRLRFRLSSDDFFFSAVTADGLLFAHLDANDFPPPQEIELVLSGPEPFDIEAIVARLGLEPGVLVHVSLASLGGLVSAVKGPRLSHDCRFPPRVDGRLYLYDLKEFRLFRLSELFNLPPIQEAALSPTGRQVVMLAEDKVLRLDRITGIIDEMAVLNEHRQGGSFRSVRFLAGVEEVFYLEYRPLHGRSRILAYDWAAQILKPLPVVNAVDESADLYLAPPY